MKPLPLKYWTQSELCYKTGITMSELRTLYSYKAIRPEVGKQGEIKGFEFMDVVKAIAYKTLKYCDLSMPNKRHILKEPKRDVIAFELNFNPRVVIIMDFVPIFELAEKICGVKDAVKMEEK